MAMVGPRSTSKHHIMTKLKVLPNSAHRQQQASSKDALEEAVGESITTLQKSELTRSRDGSM
eukprot:967573-Amphidinium_carterae.2